MLVGALMTTIGGGLYLRRRKSSDDVQIARDKADKTEVESLAAEVQRLRRQATDDARMVAQLTADNMHLRGDVGRLTGDIRRMIRGLPREMQRVLATDFAGLDSRGGDER